MVGKGPPPYPGQLPRGRPITKLGRSPGAADPLTPTPTRPENIRLSPPIGVTQMSPTSLLTPALPEEHPPDPRTPHTTEPLRKPRRWHTPTRNPLSAPRPPPYPRLVGNRLARPTSPSPAISRRARSAPRPLGIWPGRAYVSSMATAPNSPARRPALPPPF